MKRAQRYFLTLWVVSCVFYAGVSMAQTEPVAPSAVEIIIHGKRYESMHDYKLEQIERILRQALSFQHLKEFSEEELYEAIKKVRKRQMTGSSVSEVLVLTGQNSGKALLPEKIVQEDGQEFGSSQQMVEMLNDYLRGHKGAEPLFVDPDKVKSVIIKSKE